MNNQPADIRKDIAKRALEALQFDTSYSVASLEEKYPKRALAPGAMVTRIALSPTGFLHIGTAYTAMICKKFAQQTGGVYFLRIEDTDKKREVEGARGIITRSLKKFNLEPDEGEAPDGTEHGAYGPYSQSARKNIYLTYAGLLLERGDAYVCFASEEEIDAMRQKQEAEGLRPGYYGSAALWRDAEPAAVLERLQTNAPFVIRLKSRGDHEKTLIVRDLLKGEIAMRENDQDIVLIKSDGLPTYHFAHAVDDHIMGTTHVIRGDEWLSSAPLHYELFDILGFERLQYAHIAPICKLDENGNKRKLSKRKDPEANVEFFFEHGYPEEAIIEYLFNLANSTFEDWRKEHPGASTSDFTLTFDKLADSNSPLLSDVKLRDICKEFIATKSADEVYAYCLTWATSYNQNFASHLTDNHEQWIRIFSIERGGVKPRKDIALWSEVEAIYNLFWKEPSSVVNFAHLTSKLTAAEAKDFIQSYAGSYDPKQSKDEWFLHIKSMCATYHLADGIKALKGNPELYKGHVGELTQLLRYALTGKTETPDLYEIMTVLGHETTKRRLENFAATIAL